MPLVPLHRRTAGEDKKAGTAAALAELKAKRAERQAKLQMLSEAPMPESLPADADAALDDWSSDDDDGGAPDTKPTSPSPKHKPARRLVRKAATAPSTSSPASLPDSPSDLVSQLGSLSLAQPKNSSRARSPSPSDDADASSSDQDADSASESGSDTYEADSDVETAAETGSDTDDALSSHSPAPIKKSSRPSAPLPAKPQDLVLDTDFTVPHRVAKDLYTYQVDGLRWLHSLFKQRKGGILGDDMGMGKTRQCAAFIAGLFHSRKANCVLIVAPLTLLQNWRKELKELGLSHLVLEYHGSAKKTREAELQRVQQTRGVVLTTYGMVQHNHEKLAAGSRYQANSEEDDDEFRWDCVILDEGHTVKNPSTKQYKALKGLPVALCVLVTGTPIQNNLVELHALYNMCNEGLLGDAKDFKAAFEKPILASHARDATVRQRQLGAAKGDELRKIIKPFFLRREKKDLARLMAQGDQAQGSFKAKTLPAKNDLVVWLRLKPLQEKIYYAFLNSSAVKAALLTNQHVLAALGALNKICNHPALLSKAAESQMLAGANRLANGQRLEDDSDFDDIEDADSDGDSMDSFIVSDDEDDWSDEEGASWRKQKGKKSAKDKVKAAGKSKKQQQKKKLPAAEAEEEEELNLEALWGEGSMQDLQGQLLTDMQQQGWEASCKTTFVLELLKSLKAAGHRVLIFGRSRVMLRIVRAACDGEGIKTIYMDGEINVKDRDQVVQRFRSDTSITAFLLTTKVGGVGLTLTEADRVIIMEPDWNPSNDSQSVDRAYRIGQDKAVVVYRLATCGTIEEKMYRRQVFKGGLFRTGTEEGLQMRYFSGTELRELFSVTAEELRESVTQKQLNEKHAHQREYTPEVAAHVEALQQLPHCNGVHDHDLLFSEKPPEEPPLSPGSLAALEAQEARAKANPAHFGTGPLATASGDLSDMLAQSLQLGSKAVGAAAGAAAGAFMGGLGGQQGGTNFLVRAISEAEDNVTLLKASILRWERNLGLSLPDSGAKARQELASLRHRLATAEANLTALRSQRSAGLLADPAAPSTAAPPPSTIPKPTFYPAAGPAPTVHSPTPAPLRQITSVTPQGSFAIKSAAPAAAALAHLAKPLGLSGSTVPMAGQATAPPFSGPLRGQPAPAPASEAFGLRPLGQAAKTSPSGAGATATAARSAGAAPQPQPVLLPGPPAAARPTPASNGSGTCPPSASTHSSLPHLIHRSVQWLLHMAQQPFTIENFSHDPPSHTTQPQTGSRLLDITNKASAAAAAPALKKPSPPAPSLAPSKAAARKPASSAAVVVDDVDGDEIVRLAPRPAAKAPVNVVDLTDE